jgi:hypothetical protein
MEWHWLTLAFPAKAGTHGAGRPSFFSNRTGLPAIRSWCSGMMDPGVRRGSETGMCNRAVL